MTSTNIIHPTYPVHPTRDKVVVWHQTLDKYYNDPDVPSVKYRDMDDSEFVAMPRTGVGHVTFSNEDCIDVARQYVIRKYNPILLNMADWEVAGGNVEIGSASQEEECFRRSNYYKHLSQSMYPLGKFDTIVSKGVEYYRYGGTANYGQLPEPFKVDMIAAASIRNPPLTLDEHFMARKEDEEVMRKKIRMLMYCAKKNGNDVLILSAWGCGVHNCPVVHMAKIFSDEIGKWDRGLFKEVVFAITGRNYQLFRDIYFNMIGV